MKSKQIFNQTKHKETLRTYIHTYVRVFVRVRVCSSVATKVI